MNKQMIYRDDKCKAFLISLNDNNIKRKKEEIKTGGTERTKMFSYGGHMF